jgi:hypothetical protein
VIHEKLFHVNADKSHRKLIWRKGGKNDPKISSGKILTPKKHILAPSGAEGAITNQNRSTHAIRTRGNEKYNKKGKKVLRKQYVSHKCGVTSISQKLMKPRKLVELDDVMNCGKFHFHRTNIIGSTGPFP